MSTPTNTRLNHRLHILERDLDAAEEVFDGHVFVTGAFVMGGFDVAATRLEMAELNGYLPAELLPELDRIGIPYDWFVRSWTDRWKNIQHFSRFDTNGLGTFTELDPDTQIATYDAMADYLLTHGEKGLANHVKQHHRFITPQPWFNQAANSALYRALKLIRDDDDNEAPNPEGGAWESLDMSYTPPEDERPL